MDIPQDDPYLIMTKQCTEVLNLDFSKMDITNICRGCLGLKDEANMHDLTVGSSKVMELYEDLTKIKVDSIKVPAKICSNCILLLTKTDQFVTMLRNSHNLLKNAAEDFESLQVMKPTDLDCYNLKRTGDFIELFKVKSSLVVETESICDLKSEVAEEHIDDNGCSENENYDNFSNHNDSDSSEDEIPLAKRFMIDTDKLECASNPIFNKNKKKISSEKTYKKMVEKNSLGRSEVSKSTCPVCLKDVRYLSTHLKKSHSIDSIETKYLWPNERTDKKKIMHHDLKDRLDSETKKGYSGKKTEMVEQSQHEEFYIEHKDFNNKEDLNIDGPQNIEIRKKGRKEKSKLKKHKFDCAKCEERYKTYKDIESHFNESHSLETACIICGQEYGNTLSLSYHMMVKHGKLKCCRLCLVSFKDSEELNRHYKSEEHNTKCTVCGEQFKNRKALYEHRRKKHLNPQLENQKYKCPECPKEFANPNNIKRHILSAHNDLRFLCDTCGQSYTTKRNLKLHIQKFHEGVQIETKNTKKNFFCEACGRELKIFHKYAIAMHRAKHKGHNFVCKKCYETFESEALFKKHVEENGHQLYECKKCQSEFVREENFKIHLKNHEAPGWNKNMFASWGQSAKLRNERGEFVCSYCPKVFKDKQRLDNHVRVHTGERPYKCHICAKGFKTWIHRKTHLNIHLGIKKWVCKFCSKAFTNSCTLKGHEMIHTGERPHRCPECKKGFITLSAMKKHRMVHLRSDTSNYGKKSNRLLKSEEKMENQGTENAEFSYKYSQMFTSTDVSYESYPEPTKLEPPLGIVSIEKELSC